MHRIETATKLHLVKEKNHGGSKMYSTINLVEDYDTSSTWSKNFACINDKE